MNMRFRASKLYGETKSKIVEILVEKDNISLFSQSKVLFRSKFKTRILSFYSELYYLESFQAASKAIDNTTA